MHNYQWFIDKAREIHGEDYLYEEDTYVNTRKPMWMTHKLCGFRFLQTPHNHLKGQGCPKCGKEYARTCRKNNYKNFIKENEKRFGERYSFLNIKKEYENSHSKITIKCNYCGNIFSKIACDFLTSKTGGCWCKEKQIIKKEKACIADKKKKNKSRIIPVIEIQRRLKERFPELELNTDSYKGTMYPSEIKCKTCGLIFNRSINSLFYGQPTKIGCPRCSKVKRIEQCTKSTDDYIEDVRKIWGDRYTVIGKYTSSNEKITIKCNECGRIFQIEANSLLQGHGCPYHNLNSSVKEKEISSYIKENYHGKVLLNDRTTLNGKELDIFLPERNLAFEFDGIFWHNENNKPKNYHLDKTEYCEKHDIRLIHIFEDEWIFKKNIWKSMINNILKLNNNKIYARKCIIKELNGSECKKFLEENHLQGWCPSQIKLGLFYDNELVALMTFGKSRHFIGSGKEQYELLRFCNKLNVSVVGGASKLLKYFIEKYHPSNIVSYADRRWSNGQLYDRLGFTLSHVSSPNYYYIIGMHRKNRFNFRKSILVKKYNCPMNMSE